MPSLAITNLTHNKHNKIKTTSQLRDEFNTTNFMYIYFDLATFGRAKTTTQTQPHKNNRNNIHLISFSKNLAIEENQD